MSSFIKSSSETETKKANSKLQKEINQVQDAEDWLYSKKYMTNDTIMKNSFKRKDMALHLESEEIRPDNVAYDFGNMRTPKLNENLIDTILRKPEPPEKSFTLQLKKEKERYLRNQKVDVDRKFITTVNTQMFEDIIKKKVEKKFLLNNIVSMNSNKKFNDRLNESRKSLPQNFSEVVVPVKNSDKNTRKISSTDRDFNITDIKSIGADLMNGFKTLNGQFNASPNVMGIYSNIQYKINQERHDPDKKQYALLEEKNQTDREHLKKQEKEMALLEHFENRYDIYVLYLTCCEKLS